MSELHRFAHDAMATVFEVIVAGRERSYARQAAQVCFDEVDRLENELSRFVDFSDVARINRAPAGQPVKVGPAAWECLQLAARVHAATGGAFDATVGALVDCWRAPDGGEHVPSETYLADARSRTGMGLLELNEAEHSVAVRRAGVVLDLGAIGKGYAVDQMAALLADWGITAAVIHGGQSSARAIGEPPAPGEARPIRDPKSEIRNRQALPPTLSLEGRGGARGWPVALRNPARQDEVLETVYLKDRSMGGSGVGLRRRHIIDPRTGQPAVGRPAAWAIAPTAALADALSTAFMVQPAEEVKRYCGQHPGVVGMLAADLNGQIVIERFG